MDVKKITYALAATIEAAYQISCIAHDGIINTSIVNSLVRGVLKTECERTTSIYPEKSLKNGYTFFADIKKLDPQKAMEVTRYITNIMGLMSTYLGKQALRANLAEEIQKIKENLSMQEDKSLFVCRHLGNWYGKNITEAGVYSVKIFGAEEQLRKETNLVYIRALLTSALRSTVLWQQLGGTQMNFLFNKSQISICAKQVLNNL